MMPAAAFVVLTNRSLVRGIADYIAGWPFRLGGFLHEHAFQPRALRDDCIGWGCAYCAETHEAHDRILELLVDQTADREDDHDLTLLEDLLRFDAQTTTTGRPTEPNARRPLLALCVAIHQVKPRILELLLVRRVHDHEGTNWRVLWFLALSFYDGANLALLEFLERHEPITAGDLDLVLRHVGSSATWRRLEQDVGITGSIAARFLPHARAHDLRVDLPLVEWIHRQSPGGGHRLPTLFLDRAVFQGHRDAAVFLCSHRDDPCTDIALSVALQRLDFDLVELLIPRVDDRSKDAV